MGSAQASKVNFSVQFILTTSTSSTIMKLFAITLVATMTFSSTLATPTCEECVFAMDALVTRLTAAWPEIAGLIYPRYLDANIVCGALGSCTLREWTCEECTDGLVQIATIFTQQTYIDDIIAFLQGEAYCGAHTDQATCPEDIAALMPAALPVLASLLTAQAPEICRDNVGVC